MPHFRIYIKLEGELLQEHLVADSRREVDVVYNDCQRRVNEKNGSGRVVYFDLVMVSEQSLLYLGDRVEVLNEENLFGVKNTGPFKKSGQQRKGYEDKPAMGDRRRE